MRSAAAGFAIVMAIVLGLAFTLTDTFAFIRSGPPAGNPHHVNVAGIATDDNGHVYTVGATFGFMSSAQTEAFVRAHDQTGAVLWTVQFGASTEDHPTGIASDSNGNLYISGSTLSAPAGSAYDRDAFIRSYDEDGALRWTRQVAARRGAGTDATGNDFTFHNGTNAFGVATDADGNVYMGGHTLGALEGSGAGDNDAFIRSYDEDGNLRWTRQFGTSRFDSAYGVAADPMGNVYVSGITFGAVADSSAGAADAFVRSYDGDGNLRWTRQIGTTAFQRTRGIAIARDGGVYTSGDRIHAYDAHGDLRWTQPFGESRDGPFVHGIATDANGNIFAAGLFNYGYASNAHAVVRSYGQDGSSRWTSTFGPTGQGWIATWSNDLAQPR